MVLLQGQFQPNILTVELLKNLKCEEYIFHKNGHSWNSQVTWGQDRTIPIPLLLLDRFPQTFNPIASALTSTNSDILKTETVSSSEMSDYLSTRQHKNPHLHNKFTLPKHDTSNKKHEGLTSMCDRRLQHYKLHC